MSEVSDQTKQKVAELLFKNGLLQFGEFTLKSGALSPFYIDLRKAQSFPELFHAITDAYSELMGDVPEGTLLSGIPEAATSLATAVGYKLNLPLIQPRKVVKDHGTKKSIEGEFKDGDHVWVIDDLITKGDSKLEALQQFKDNGLVVDSFYVLIDREQGGAKTLSAAGLELHAVMTISELIGKVQDAKLIDNEQAKTVLEYIRSA